MYNCYDCVGLDTESISGDTGYCNINGRWQNKLSYYTCRNFIEKSYVVTACFRILNPGNNPGSNYHYSRIIKFRDTYMKNNDEGNSFLREYDVIGPKLADDLNSDPEKHETASSIYEDYIEPMIYFIELQNNEMAQNTFKRMVEKLKSIYGYSGKQLLKDFN